MCLLWLATLLAPLLREEEREYLGTPEDNQLIRTAKDLPTICQVRFYLGLYALAAGDTVNAKRNLKACIATDQHLYLEYSMAKLFLNSIE